MDFLKTRAPFWKKEHQVDGDDGAWVAAEEKDDKDAARWVANRKIG
jgi:molybdopterin synthase catalytic subunit